MASQCKSRSSLVGLSIMRPGEGGSESAELLPLPSSPDVDDDKEELAAGGSGGCCCCCCSSSKFGGDWAVMEEEDLLAGEDEEAQHLSRFRTPNSS